MTTFADRWSQPSIRRQPGAPMMRAQGSLTYLEFVRCVKLLWEDSHPDIPVFPTGTQSSAVYPVIYYGLERRRAHQVEPKMRLREELFDDEGNAMIVNAQRFENIVSFTVITETDPILAEETIEAFEDFMIEFTPVFKRLGASEFRYGSRISDTGASRPGAGVVKRSVSYVLTTEKIIISHLQKLDNIFIDIRTRVNDDGTYVFSAKAADTVYPAYAHFSIGDIVIIQSRPTITLPAGLLVGAYMIANIIEGDQGRGYTLSKEEINGDLTPVTFAGSGGGYIRLTSREVVVTITDQFDAAG